MFLDFVHFDIWLATQVRAFKLALAQVVLPIFQVKISDWLGRLQHAFQIKNVFPLLYHDVLVNLFELLCQALALCFVADWKAFAEFLVVERAPVLRNHHALWVPAVGHDNFVVIKYCGYRTGSHTFYFLSPFLVITIVLLYHLYILFVKLVFQLKMQLFQSIFYELDRVILVFM